MAKIGDHVGIRPLRFWSQKVLPLVYDESLSYYEVLCKVVAKENEIIDIINNKLSEYIAENIDEFFGEAVYDTEAETITLSLERREA